MAYAFVQQVSNSGGSSSVTTLAASAFASSHVTGNSFVWLARYDGSASAVGVTMADTRGNTYVQVGSRHDSGLQAGMAWGYVANTVSGAATVVTATWASGITFPGIYIGEYSGLDTAAIFTTGETASNRQASPGTAANAITSTNTPTLAAQPALLWGLSHEWTNGTDTPAAGTGLTSRGTLWGFPGAGSAARVADLRLTATTAVATTWTAAAGTADFLTVAMVLKESTGGGPVVRRMMLLGAG